MRLISCYIDNFGLLSDKKIDFKRGLNCFYSSNSTGKTTLTVFIKAMFYGFGDNRASKEENERKKYYPWQGGKYGGSLTFEAGGRTYTVERSFGTKQAEDTFTLRDETTGGVSRNYGENLGEELFGIDRDGFIRTVFLSEKSIASTARVNGSVASRLSDLVGADGDVGNYKKAQDLLDERRKYYQKKGGGEIERYKAEIANCNRKLDELERLCAIADEKEKRLAVINTDIREIEAERTRLEDRLDTILKIKERRGAKESYAEMLKELEDLKARLNELAVFFRGVIPSNEEIEEARTARVEADLILKELSYDSADSELVTLSDFFAPGTSAMEIDDAERAARALKDDEARISAILTGEDERSREMRRLFPARVPEREEIDEKIALAKSRGGFFPTLLTLLGVIGIGCGIFLGAMSNALYSICAGGALLTFIGIIALVATNAKKKSAIKKFASEIIPGFSGELLAFLYEKKNDLDRYEMLAELRDEERLDLTRRVEENRATVRRLLTKLGVSAEDNEEAIRRIRLDYQRYCALTMSEERSAGSRLAKINREKELSAKAKAFVSRYPVTKEDPFAEIKDKATDYLYCSRRIESLTERCENHARVYGITSLDEKYDEAEEYFVRGKIADLDKTLTAKRNEAAVIKREWTSLINEIDTREEILAQRSAYEQRLAECQRNLEIIKKTKAILEAACDNMTSRYLGKTRDRFLHYVNMIGEGDGEYKLDTNFEITRIERGVARDEDSYSRGTKDLYSLSMRLALTDSLYDGELPFLVLDDPFLSLDDERCQRAKSVLSTIAKERQILYFTCASSRVIK